MNDQAKTIIKTEMTTEDRKVILALRRITSGGHDAEVRLKRDGSLAIYEIRRHRE